MQPGGSEPSLMPNQTFHLFDLFQPRIMYGVTCYWFDPTLRVKLTVMCIWTECNICFKLWQIRLLPFLWVRLRLTQRWVEYEGGEGNGEKKWFWYFMQLSFEEVQATVKRRARNLSTGPPALFRALRLMLESFISNVLMRSTLSGKHLNFKFGQMEAKI